MSVICDKHFHDEEAAYKFVKAHIWPDAPVCPRCWEKERVWQTQRQEHPHGCSQML